MIWICSTVIKNYYISLWLIHPYSLLLIIFHIQFSLFGIDDLDLLYCHKKLLYLIMVYIQMGKEKQMRGIPKGPNNISSMKTIIVNGKHYHLNLSVHLAVELNSFFITA